MSRRLVVGAVFASALAMMAGVSALLARSSDAADSAEPGESRKPVTISGKAAAAGDVRETTLHAAHLRGAEPVACASCHTVTPDGFTPPDRERCVSCHPEREAALHAAVSDLEVDQCRRCHDFLDSRPTAEAAWQCASCHERPHPEQLPMAGTAAETCGRCHSPHGEESQAPTACIGCHEDKVNRHRTSADPTQSCMACHRQHDDAANARTRCAECHASTRPLVPATATFPGGHVECVGCHQGHDFGTKSVRTCESCHSQQRALAADHVAAHGSCRSCHDQHAVKSAGDATCRGCHDRLAPAHPATGARKDHCLGCHPAHPDSRTIVRSCSSCHQKARDDRAFHGGARCTDCHREHDFKLTGGPSLCLGCHSGRVGNRPAVVTSTGHADCGGCHGGKPHALNRPPACGNCHAAEAGSAPRGHSTCTDCHEQHTGKLRRKATTCTGCHTDRKAGPHAAITGGCRSCHRPHGPGGLAAPPACASCHDRGKLPGLHAVAKHGSCTDCHRSHAPPAPAAAACRACHPEMRDHEPTATTCTGCHLFGDDP